MTKNSLILFVSTVIILSSCSDSPKEDVVSVKEQSKERSFEVEVFEVKDSSGIFQGWGYDIYVDQAKAIHQPTIPAISGIYSFKTKEDALKTGTFAADKMRSSGFLPTLSLDELDSLGVIPTTKQ